MFGYASKLEPPILPAMTPGLAKPGRQTRRAACAWCHERKVRCDASVQGVPCTTCKLNNHTCMVLKTRRMTRYVVTVLEEALSPYNRSSIYLDSNPFTCGYDLGLVALWANSVLIFSRWSETAQDESAPPESTESALTLSRHPQVQRMTNGDVLPTLDHIQQRPFSPYFQRQNRRPVYFQGSKLHLFSRNVLCQGQLAALENLPDVQDSTDLCGRA